MHRGAGRSAPGQISKRHARRLIRTALDRHVVPFAPTPTRSRYTITLGERPAWMGGSPGKGRLYWKARAIAPHSGALKRADGVIQMQRRSRRKALGRVRVDGNAYAGCGGMCRRFGWIKNR